jgi:hypothetical protein
MSKILKSFGMAALLVALLAGTGMADVPVNVDGCVIHATTFSLAAGTVVDKDLGILPTPDPAGIAGGSLEVIAGDDYTVTVDDAGAGKMLKGVTPLTNAFVVNAVTLDGTAKTLDTGNANVDCDPQEIAVVYHQTVDAGDEAGDYAIALTYAGSLDP